MTSTQIEKLTSHNPYTWTILSLKLRFSHQKKKNRPLFQTRRNSELGIPIIDSGAKKNAVIVFSVSGMVVIPSSLSRCVGQKLRPSETLHLLPRVKPGSSASQEPSSWDERATSVTDDVSKKIPMTDDPPYVKMVIFVTYMNDPGFHEIYGSSCRGKYIYQSHGKFWANLSRWCFFLTEFWTINWMTHTVFLVHAEFPSTLRRMNRLGDPGRSYLIWNDLDHVVNFSIFDWNYEVDVYIYI